jgi:hypothetical protein
LEGKKIHLDRLDWIFSFLQKVWFHDIESKAFSKSINKNKPGISFSSAYSIISNKSLIFSPYWYSLGSLSVTQKQCIITCLPKGDKSRHFLKNWQPISLLNTVYKIGSGVIANRIKKVLPTTQINSLPD